MSGEQRLMLTAGQRWGLWCQLQQTRDARVYRRTLAMLEVDRGKAIAEIARTFGVSRRTVYYWVEDYIRRHEPDDLVPAGRPGRPTLWMEETRTLVQQLLRVAPTERGDYAAHWTVPRLQEELWHATGNRYSDDTIRRELHRLGYVWKRPWYALQPDPELEKKTADSAADRGLAFP